MTALVRLVIVLAVAGVLIALASPWLKDAVYAAQLFAAAPPAALPVPVDGVASRAIANSWGTARSGGRQHEGVDIFARRGTPVVSTTRGLVWRIGTNNLGGNVVWVLGPGGQLHYYAHLDRVAAIRVRQRVDVGDVIGFVGTSGNAAKAPPHLHYGIYRPSGKAVDPFPLLTAPSGERNRATADTSG